MQIPNPEKKICRKRKFMPISLLNIDAKIFNKIFANRAHEKNHIPRPSGFTPGIQEWFNIHLSLNLRYVNGMT
jgi:hypothetical protein